MAQYKKKEAREWARAKMHGVANVVIPSYTNDLRGLNERGIRHDIRHEIELGFWGTLLVSETALTVEEYGRFFAWSADEAKGRLHLIHHASFNTLAENIEATQVAEQNGADLILLSYPPCFFPETGEEIYDYTKAFCDAANLGVILFPVPLWGFERIHPAGIPPAIIARMVENIPNIVCIKAEGGMPAIGGFTECWHAFHDKLVVTFPIESEALPLATLVPMQFIGTSNSEYYGGTVPRIFKMIREENREKAMELYWRIHPARMANHAAFQSIQGAHFLHRLLWKYQGWLQGFNGGPLRMPTMRLHGKQMRELRQALMASKLEPTTSPDRDFFIGRNPA
ncbi:MAG: dihydrodipicolinate synthase family protein [Candidatus Binataceae bacterium]